MKRRFTNSADKATFKVKDPSRIPSNDIIIVVKRTELKKSLAQNHSCKACSIETEFNELSELREHLQIVHTLEFKEYAETFDIKCFHKLLDADTDLEYEEVNFKKIKDPKAESISVDDSKKPYVKINGEVVRRKSLLGIDAYERMDYTVKKKKGTAEKLVFGGLHNEDLNYIPELNANFDLSEKFHKQLVMTAVTPGFRTILLTGDMGLGKSESVLQVASRLRQPVIRIPLTGDTKVKDIFIDENFDKVEKKIIHVDKFIVEAMKKGYWLLVDEFSAGNPSVMFIFFQLMETGSVTTPDGTVQAHPMFKLFLTDNRIGNPNYYRYHGTMQQNAALLNRIRTVIVFDNLKSSIELKILKAKYPDANDGFLDKLIDFAKQLREANKKGDYQETFPIRSTQNIADNYEITKDFTYALELGYLNSVTDEADKNLIKELYQRVFGSARIERDTPTNNL